LAALFDGTLTTLSGGLMDLPRASYILPIFLSCLLLV
jgi:hypothetical protein